MTRSTSLIFVVSRLQEELSRLLHEAMELESSPRVNEPEPRLDVLETNDSLVVMAEVPGVDSHELSLESRDDILVLRVQKNVDSAWSEARFHCVECTRGEFERRIPLPRGFDPARARATLRDGLLRVEIPRAASGEAGTAIPIENLEERPENESTD